jgi:DnaJ-class molecular chaperone
LLTFCIKYHPDKQTDGDGGQGKEQESRKGQFERIERAYRVLYDDNERMQFDAQLQEHRSSADVLINEELELSDLQQSEGKSCRAG